MPMTWNDEAQAKLYAIILQVCDVKPSEAQKVEIASRMGPDCTAKAITHKIAAIRKAAAGTPNATTGSRPTGITKKSTPRKKGRAVAVKKELSPFLKSEDEDDKEKAAGLTTPPPSGTKNLKRKLQGVDVDEAFYKDGIDVAVGEDIGQGFRKRRDEESDGDDRL
ncbi:unnamed protein product [Cercospora beticola]|nr:unnamed protein product [Cercospora beticola]